MQDLNSLLCYLYINTLSILLISSPCQNHLLCTQQIFLVLLVSPNYHALVLHTHPTRLTYISLIYSTNIPSSPCLSYTFMLSSYILTQPVSRISLKEHLKSFLLTNPYPFHLHFLPKQEFLS